MDLNRGSLLAETLAKVAPVVFTLHGGHLDSFFHGCRDSGIDLLDFRHEAAAVNAADGYARVTGGLGVAAVTSGPGFTNAYAGLANAYADGVPVLLAGVPAPTRCCCWALRSACSPAAGRGRSSRPTPESFTPTPTPPRSAGSHRSTSPWPATARRR
jgi:Thiamine pyrophosphate enzyme, N-terminal TPP binding domain